LEVEFTRLIHKENTGGIVDMRWSGEGNQLFIVWSKRITCYEFDENKKPILKIKSEIDDM
jgi:hypothetical protein